MNAADGTRKYAGACWNYLMEEETKESIAELYMDSIRRERVLREALEEIGKYAAYGTATKQKDVRGRQFGAIHAIALGALAAPAPEQPPLTVQPQANGVLVEDPTRNLSVLQVEQPLLVTCPFDGQQWRFHTQEQVGMFQKHLDWHAKEGSK